MRFKVDVNIKVKQYNNEKSIFDTIRKKLTSNEVLIDFCKTKAKTGQKREVFNFLRHCLSLEREFNKEITIIFPSEIYRRIAHRMLKELIPNKIKIGIALGGGGARGALQIGQLKVLKEYGILDMCDAMAGTSIGSMNMIGYYSMGLDKLEDVWKSNMGKVAYKKRLKFKESISNVAIFDRSETKEYLMSLFDENLFDFDYPECYVNTYSLKERKLKVFHINHRSKERIVESLLASSAIPFVYGVSKYDGDVYIDGGVVDNQSIRCLIDNGCNVIFAASLSVYPKCSNYAKEGVCIIDMGSVNFYKDLLSGSFSFDKNIENKIKHGYDVSLKLFNKLNYEKVLDIILKKDANRFYELDSYYGLSKEENTFKFDKSLL